MPDIADLVAQYLGPQDVLGMTDATLTRQTSGARDPANLSAGPTVTTTSYTARGMIEATGRFSDGTLVRENHVLITLLGGTIQGGVVPVPGDTITIASKQYPAGATYKVTRIVGDTVGATYECEATR